VRGIPVAEKVMIGLSVQTWGKAILTTIIKLTVLVLPFSLVPVAIAL
jgi:hypothetical protein